MRFAEDRDGPTLALTCPYCLVSAPYIITTAPTVTCQVCGRAFDVLPNKRPDIGHDIVFRASADAQHTHLNGQHRAYQFGRAAVFSPLVGGSTPRLWRLGRYLIGCNALLLGLAMANSPNNPWTLLMLVGSYLSAMVFCLLRTFLWGCIRLADIEETRPRDIIKHHRAFEQGYAETVSAID